MRNIEILEIKKSHCKPIVIFQKKNREEIGNNLWNEKEILMSLNDKNFFGRACLYNKKINGFLLGRKIDDFFELISIFITPKLRNKGIGGQMIESCKNFCRKMMLKEIIIEVNDKNMVGKEFYLKNKFCFFGKRKKYYEVREEKIDACLMKLKI